MASLESIRHVATFTSQYVTPLAIVALVALDVVALRFGIREARARKAHMKELRETTRVYARDSYELLVLQSFEGAGTRIFCYWHSLTAAAGKPRYQAFNKQLASAHAKGADVRLITAKDPKRLNAAQELRDSGVEVRFLQALLFSDLRYTAVDNDLIVFGLTPSVSDREKPSREGADVKSQRLSSILRRDFLEQWAAAATYDAYLDELLNQAYMDPQCTPAMVAEKLGIPESEVLRRWAPVA